MNQNATAHGQRGVQSAGLRSMAALAAFCLVLVSLFGAPRAAADPIGSDSLLQQSTLVVNQQSDVYSFAAPGAGTLVVQLDDIVWPLALQSLGMSINSANSIMGSLTGDGTIDVSVSHAGTYYADVNGTAGGPLDLGLYSLQVNFIPLGAPVPLPGTFVLMLAGLTLLYALRVLWERRPLFGTTA